VGGAPAAAVPPEGEIVLDPYRRAHRDHVRDVDQPEHFARWLPPTGMTMPFIEADIRVGGSAK
jgi:hypothetical protein